MSDRVIASEADQRIPRFKDAPYAALDQIPGIGPRVELQVAMVHEPPGSTQVDARLGPDAVGVGMQLAADERRCDRGA